MVDAYDAAAAAVPGLRMVVVTGPRHRSRRRCPLAPGLEVHAYVPDLYRQLAACDLAVVQGGLTTRMELTAAGRPFIYVPLRHHFEQNFHVAPPARAVRRRTVPRLRRHHAGLTRPAIAEEIGRETGYRPVETDGAARAADLIAELL